MSAECGKHGCDLMFDENMDMFCPICKKEETIIKLKARIKELEAELQKAKPFRPCQTISAEDRIRPHRLKGAKQ
jgi:hypothetical protein